MTQVRDLRSDSKSVILHPRLIAQSIRYAYFGRQGLLPSIKTSQATLERGRQNMEMIKRVSEARRAANDPK